MLAQKVSTLSWQSTVKGARVTLITLVLMAASAAMAEMKSVSIGRTLSDKEFGKIFATKKIVAGKWYPFHFEPGERLVFYRKGKIPAAVLKKYANSRGMVKFTLGDGKLEQMSFRGFENTCLTGSLFEQIKKFLHVQIETTILRRLALVAVMSDDPACDKL